MPPRQNSASRRAQPRRTQGAKRGASKSSGGGMRIPGWLWAIGGIIAGFFIAKHFLANEPSDSQSGMAAIVTRPVPSEPQGQSAEQSQSDAQQSGQPSTPQAQQEGGEDPANNMPTFEFYTLLPESEVIAPSAPSAPAAAPQAPPAATPSQSASREPAQPSTQTPPAAPSTPSSSAPASAQGGASYMLQAASFRSQADANTMAGRFRDLGLVTQVSQVKTGDGTTWYRVQAGPYSDQAELARARGLMQARGVDPLMIRQR